MKKYIYYYHPDGGLDQLVPLVLQDLNWSYSQEGNLYKISLSPSFFSWGLKMQIKLVNSHQCNMVVSPKLITQIFDWGEGGRKINEFVEALQNKSK